MVELLIIIALWVGGLTALTVESETQSVQQYEQQINQDK